MFLSSMDSGITGLITFAFHGFAKIALGNFVAVLRGNDDAINASRTAIDVFDRDLRLAVWPEEINNSLLADFRELVRELVRQLDRHGHQLRRLVAGEAEHHALIAGAAGIHTHRDVWRLLLNRADHAAGFRVETKFRTRVADVADNFAREVGKIDVCSGGDLTGNHNQAGGNQGLAAYAALGVVLQNCIEDGVRNLVGYLVRMAFSDRFRGKQELLIRVRQNSILQRNERQSRGQIALSSG